MQSHNIKIIVENSVLPGIQVSSVCFDIHMILGSYTYFLIIKYTLN